VPIDAVEPVAPADRSATGSTPAFINDKPANSPSLAQTDQTDTLAPGTEAATELPVDELCEQKVDQPADDAQPTPDSASASSVTDTTPQVIPPLLRATNHAALAPPPPPPSDIPASDTAQATQLPQPVVRPAEALPSVIAAAFDDSDNDEDDQMSNTTANSDGRSIWIIVLLVLAIIIAMVGVGLLIMAKFRADPANSNGGPTGAVEQYLQAIARGDADQALRLSASQPINTDLMTDQFLKSTVAAYPISDISVTPLDSLATPAEVTASYRIGNQPVVGQFEVQQYTDGWLLDGTFITLDLSELTSWNIPLTINDQPVDTGEAISLFPGTYVIASSNSFLQVDNATFTVEYPQKDPEFGQLGLSLTITGADAIRAAAQAKLADCLTKQDLAPAGCGFGFAGTSNGSIDPATINWSIADASSGLDQVALTLDAGSSTTASASINLPIDFHAVSTDGSVNYSDTVTVISVTADFSTPDHILVSFK
jgi:hypothetical protein